MKENKEGENKNEKHNQRDETSNPQIREADADNMNPKEDDMARQEYNEHTRRDQDKVEKPELKEEKEEFTEEEAEKKEKK
jgi:hypothetical protein